CMAVRKEVAFLAYLLWQCQGLIQLFIIRPLDITVFLRRDYRLHALSFCLSNNSITIITSVRNQPIRMKSINQAACCLQSTELTVISCYTTQLPARPDKCGSGNSQTL